MDEGPILVVCPAVLRFSWAEELERWLPFCLPADIHLGNFCVLCCVVVCVMLCFSVLVMINDGIGQNGGVKVLFFYKNVGCL